MLGVPAEKAGRAFTTRIFWHSKIAKKALKHAVQSLTRFELMSDSAINGTFHFKTSVSRLWSPVFGLSTFSTYLCLKFFKMGIIKLKNIRVYAYHGCLLEEGKIGSDYRVDVSVNADLTASAQSDNLADTVDYVHLNKIVKQEMAIRSKLLETVVKRILDRIFMEIPMVEKADVSVSKINPPIGGNVAMVTVEMSKERS